MLACEDQTPHTRVARGFHDLIGSEVRGVEDGGRLVAVAPLLVCERIDGEVQEAVELHLVPAQLACRGERPERRRVTDQAKGLERYPRPGEGEPGAERRRDEPAARG